MNDPVSFVQVKRVEQKNTQNASVEQELGLSRNLNYDNGDDEENNNESDNEENNNESDNASKDAKSALEEEQEKVNMLIQTALQAKEAFNSRGSSEGNSDHI